MASKRERENGDRVEEEGLDFESKRQRVDEESSPSPPPVSIANPLSGLANNYADIDEEEDYYRRDKGSISNNRNDMSQHNGHKYEGSDDSDEDDDSEDQPLGGRSSRQVEVRKDCPYLDTVNRQVLDFDFEKFCSVSLSNLNVYACLVCGKYYQVGEGRSLMPIRIAWKPDTMFISISRLRKSTVFQMVMKLMILHWMTFDMSSTRGDHHRRLHRSSEH